MSDDNSTEETKTRGELAIEGKIDKGIVATMPVSSLGLAFKDMLEVMEFAKMMAVSRAAVPAIFRENPGACLAVVMQANALGFEPFSFARKCYFVNDNLAYEGQLIHAIITRNGPFVKRPTVTYSGEGPERKCHVILHMAEPDGDKTYDSPALKDIKPQNSPLWKSDPDQQLHYYSVRAAARRHTPDVIMGMYDQEEMAAERAKDVTPTGRPVQDISAKLAQGNKPDIVYTSGRTAEPVTATAPDGGAIVVEQEGSENGPQTGDQSGGSGTAPEAGEPTSVQEAESTGDIFGAGLVLELKTALADPSIKTAIDVKVLADEFAASMATASPEVGAEMQRLLDAAQAERS